MFSDMLPAPVKHHSRKLEGVYIKDKTFIPQKPKRSGQIMKDYMQNTTF